MTHAKKGITITTGKAIQIVCILLFIVLIAQLFRWQILNNDRFLALANEQRTSQQEIFTKRGTIYTQDGVVLSVDSPSWDVILSIIHDVDREKLLDPKTNIRGQMVDEMVDLLGADKADLYKKTEQQNLSYVVLYSGINKRQKDIIDSKAYPGVYTIESPKRIYPNGQLAAQLIGYVGTDQYGRPKGYYGLEGFFWGDIKGKRGISQQENDLVGNAIISRDYQNISFREGKNIVLTINSGIQRKVEKILEQGVKDLEGDSGTVVIMNPKTGEIISMANYPTYDPNAYWETKDVSVFKNKGVSDPYEFGSVEKPITIAMAMNEGKLKETDLCNDTGVLNVLDKQIFNYGKKKYGMIQPKDTLRYSDNICAATYGLSVGPKVMYDYLKKFGYSQQVGLGLQEEETTFLKDPSEWVDTDTATISFGQTISATPLQVLSAFSALANDGERMQPQLVKKIYNNEEEINIAPVSAGQIVKPEVARKVGDMLEYAIMTQKDFAKYKGKYSIAGKTGTAQIPKKDGPGYYEDRVNVSIIGFSPSHNARVVMIVKVEHPRKGDLANLTVLPLWGKIFDSIKDDLGVPRIN